MTTLPESTAIRVRDPGNGGPMMLPPALGQQPGPASMTGADVWRVIRGSLWWILGSLLLSGIAGVVLNKVLQRYAPSYTATGLIKIEPAVDPDPRNSKPITIDMNTLEIEQRTQAQLLKHEGLYAKIFSNPDSKVRQTAWFAQFDGDALKAKNALMSSVSVAPIPDSKLIRLSVSVSNPRDALTLLQAVGDQHIIDTQGTARNEQLQRSTLLSSLQQQYDRRLADIGREIREKAIQLNLDGMGAPGRLSTREIELGDLVKSQLEAEMKLSEAKGILGTIETQLARGDVPGAVEEVTNRDPLLAQLRQAMIFAQIDTSDVSGTFGGDNPRMTQRDDRIRAIQQQYEQKLAEAQGRAQLMVLEQFRNEVATRQEQLASIATRVDSHKKEMGSLNNAMNTYLALKDDETTTRQLLQEVNDQLDYIRQSSSQTNSGLVEWAGAPEQPQVPTFPRLPVTLALSILAGLGLSVGTAFLRELTDNSIRSPRDVARVGQLNLLGMVPHVSDDPKAIGARLPMIIFEAPGSMVADQFRQIRTRLQYVTHLDSVRTLMVTSPGMEDGKTSVTCNLAAGLALNGRRILLVDADLRRPTLHLIYGLDNTHGFGDLLAGAPNDGSSIHPTPVPNLSVLPAGPRPANATELLESHLFNEFVESMSADFDHIIFDTGSVMLVSESMALAPRVDGVITVVRATTNTRGDLQQMRDALRDVKAENLGVILNGVRAHSGGGYDGSNIRDYYAYQQARQIKA